jgi:hypothetical protein
MSERYPDSATLLALAADDATGVEFIPTGLSPYHLEFRRLVQRLLLAAGRAGDLRVYQDGDLSLGVRPGRCLLRGAARAFAGATEIAVAANATTHVWLDAAGAVQTGTAGLPADRTSFLPLAAAVAGASSITSLTDLRGEAFLLVPDLATLGVTVTAERLSAALAGTNPTVVAAALNLLTAGPLSTADNHHRHLQVAQQANAETYFTLTNDHAGANASVALVLSLPQRLPDDLVLAPNLATGFLSQRYQGQTYHPVGVVHAQWRGEGALAASQLGKLVGVVPADGAVTDVILSLGANLQSSVGADGVSATVNVNGVALTTTHPAITSSAGAGFRSTARGDGTPAALKTDGTQAVRRGDVLTLDFTRTAGGSVSAEPANAGVLVVIRTSGPE